MKRLSKRVLLVAVGGVLTVAVAAFLIVYFVIFPTSSPKPFRIATSVARTSTSGLHALDRQFDGDQRAERPLGDR